MCDVEENEIDNILLLRGPGVFTYKSRKMHTLCHSCILFLSLTLAPQVYFVDFIKLSSSERIRPQVLTLKQHGNILFQNINTISLTRAQWLFTFVIDLELHFPFINKLKSNLMISQKCLNQK